MGKRLEYMTRKVPFHFQNVMTDWSRGQDNMLWTWKLYPLKKSFCFLFQNDVSKECDIDSPLEESKDNYPTLISPL